MRAQTTRKNSPNKSPYANMATVRTSWGPRYAAFTGISSLSKDAHTETSVAAPQAEVTKKVSSKTSECF